MTYPHNIDAPTHYFWRGIVERFSYKPNVQLRVYNPNDNPTLHVVMHVPNTYDPDNPEMVTVTHRFALPWRVLPDKDAIGIIRSHIRTAEAHEADEWIRVAGEMLFNPHTVGRSVGP
jgi:hypothetical protein